MADRRRIVDMWRSGRAAVLVTLVRTEGSSYRRPGARLLIGTDASEYAGTISGGCLEAEVVRKAAWLVEAGATVKRYSTLFDDTAEIPFGLGCGGVVDLLVEPAHSAEAQALLQAIDASLTGEQFRVVTWLPENQTQFARVIFDANCRVVFHSDSLSVGEVEAARTATSADASMYFEELNPPQRLFVLGAGDDAGPVVTLASLLGWRAFVADRRPQMALPHRFPAAERVITLGATEELGLRVDDAVVLMTHSYEQDRAFLAGLLGAHITPGYIGLLGATHRSSLLINETAAMLGKPVAECCQSVWAPVGLDIGGDGAEAIALAIIAEVQAWREGKLRTERRLTPELVASQAAKYAATQQLRSECAVSLQP